ncbi:MAG TPA: hypothetical protein VMS71_03885, partial [Candidatus Acidoferrum sp.]|nr:hypothetical protein [Candidatus Acidoferrum sp.]
TDGGLDSVEKAVPYMPANRVNQMHRSERDKERKFSQTLEEEIEEEREKTHKQKDEVVISQELPDQQTADQDPGEEVLTESPDADETKTPESEDERQKPDGHIDVTA